MVRSTIFSITLLLSTFFNLTKAVTAEGSLWLLDETKGKKEIALFFDVHNQKRFELREMEELKELLEILELYSKTAHKPLHILVEHSFDPPGCETILGSLFKILEENPLPNIIVENIEQRAASASFEDLIKFFPNHNKRRFTHWASATNQVFYDAVSIQDVVNEYNLISLFLEEAYKSITSEKIKDIHDEKMKSIEAHYKAFNTQIQKLQKYTEVRFEEILKCNPPPPSDYVKWLGELVHDMFSELIDLYLLHRVLALPTDHKIMVLAGAQHSLYVKGEIMGFLDAEPTCRYGRTSIPAADLTALTKEQVSHIIFSEKVESHDL